MNYDRKKVEIIMELNGRDGIAFFEYRVLSSGEIKILQAKNFFRRYGIEG